MAEGDRMDDEFMFDDIPVEFADEEAEAGDTAWDAEFAELDDNVEYDEELKIIDRFKKMMSESRLSLLPLVLAKSNGSPYLQRNCEADVWALLPSGGEYPHIAWMSEFTVAQLGRIAMRMITTCVYTSDGGFHYNRYHGNGSYVAGNWEPKNECLDYVVAVAPDLEACAMAASACIDVRSVRTNAMNGNRVQTNVSYEFVDVSGSNRHTIDFKRKLVRFLAPLPAGEKWTNERFKKRGFVWEAVARKLIGVNVTIPEMSSLAGFHLHVNKKFALPKTQIPVDDILASPLAMNVYRDIIKSSWFYGGMFIRAESFLTRAHDLFPGLAWSGSIPTSLPNWATVAGRSFERDGASAGNPTLALDVKAVSVRSNFTGVVWNPSGVGSEYVCARGVAIPVGTDFATAKSGLEWCSENRTCAIILINSPTPFILCIKDGEYGDLMSTHGCQFSRAAFLALWKAAPCVGYYNFLANLCGTYYKWAHPSKPWFCTGYVNGRLVGGSLTPNQLPLGRYAVREENTKVTSAEGLFDRYFRDGSSSGARRSEPEPGYSARESASSKRPRTTD